MKEPHGAFHWNRRIAQRGKSTLFTALTKKGGLAANYPFATIDPNVGIVDVPDDRLQALADIVHPGRIVPATVEFVDIAGLVKGPPPRAPAWEISSSPTSASATPSARWSATSRIRTSCARSTTPGAFVDPASDAETIMTELILADIQTLEKQLPKLEKEAKRDKELMPKLEIAKRLVAWLNEGNRAHHARDDRRGARRRKGAVPAHHEAHALRGER